jgi:hypothetical protein
MALSFDPGTGRVEGQLQKKKTPRLGEVLSQTFGRPEGTPFVQQRGPEFFDKLAARGGERLRRQYFDEGGVQSQVEENLASRGLIGSGVEQAIQREQVYEPFAQGSRDINEQVALQEMQANEDASKFEAQLAMAEQGRLSAEQQADLDRQLQQMQLQIGAINDARDFKFRALTTPMGKMSYNQRASMEELLNPSRPGETPLTGDLLRERTEAGERQQLQGIADIFGPTLAQHIPGLSGIEGQSDKARQANLKRFDKFLGRTRSDFGL